MNERLYCAANLLSECAEQGMSLRLNGQGGLAFEYFGKGDSRPLLAKVKALKIDLIEYLELLEREPHRVPIRASAQQLMLHQQQCAEPSAAFNIVLQFELHGELSFADFQAWAETVVLRHPQLQSRFKLHQGNLYVQQDTSYDVVIGRHTQRAALDTCKTTPFDVQNGPLFRFDWIETATGKRCISLVFHHLIFDGYSVKLLAEDVHQYLGLSAEDIHSSAVVNPALPKVNRVHNDWAEYVEYLNGFEPLDWQQVFGNRGDNSTTAKLYRSMLSESQFAELNGVAKANQMSPFVLQTAITALVLSVYSDSRRFLLFTPADTRSGDQLSCIGHFVHMLAVPCEINLDSTATEYLSRMRDRFMHVLARSELSYDNANLWSLSQEKRVLPPIKAVIAQQSFPQTSVDIVKGQARLDFIASQTREVKYPLVLNCQSNDQQTRLEWEYDSRLFNESQIRQIQNHWFLVLELLSNHALSLKEQFNARFLSEYDLLPLSKLKGASGTVLPQWQQRTIVDSWQQNVAKYGERRAVGFGESWLSYRELDRKTNKLARELRAIGVDRESKVIVSLGRGLDLLCGILAILKAGGVYVPVDPKAPEERIAHISTDSGARWILCDQQWRQGDISVINMAELWEQSKLQSHSVLTTQISPHDAAYIIYTSGSTGVPKGVVVEHRNVVRLIGSAMNVFDFNADDVWCLFHSFAFDFSVWEIFGPWLTGGAVAIVPDECLLQPSLFHSFLRQNRITILNQTPSAFYNLIDADSQDDNALSDLRYVVFGGEALSLPRLKPWFSRYDADVVKLVNMYGITETTVHVTHYTLNAQDCSQTQSIIGVPLSDLSVYLLGKDDLVLPAGVKGEMYVSGPGLAREYLGKPELTAERFISHPHAGRLYRSGDFARFDVGGELVYLGRKDNQVKVRGYRIELEEIRQQLMSLNAINDAVLTVAEFGAGDKLIAFVVTAQNALFDVAEIKRELVKKLPPYMIPALIHAIDHIPQTTNGKADVRRLMTDYHAAIDCIAQQNDVMPDHPLYHVISSVLGTKLIGPDDNLFALGLDSISCIRLVNSARDVGVHFSVADVYRELTPRRLLALAEKSPIRVVKEVADKHDFLKENERKLVTDQIEMIYPLTMLQQGMCYHSELDIEGGVYHDVFGYRLQMHFDVDKLRAVLKQMMKLHPVLRTRLMKGPERLLQAVVVEPDVPLQVFDVAGDIDSGLAQYQAFLEAEIANGFSYRDPLLYRLFLHRFDDGSEQLTLSFHHALFDGWSVANFNTELMNRYRDAEGGSVVAISEANNSHYRDYVFTELAALEDEAHRAFWQSQLCGAEVSNLPSVAKQTLSNNAEFTHLPCETFEKNSAAIIAAAKTAGVTVRQWMLAVHLNALSILSHRSRVNTTVVYNNRLDRADSDVQLGLFLNSLPFDIDLTAESWLHILDKVVTLDRQIMAYRALPAVEIQKLCGLSFQSILFNYTDFHVYDALLDDGLPLLDSTVFESVNFPLTIDCGVSTQTKQLRYQVGFDGQHHSKLSVMRYVKAVDMLCVHALAHPSAPLPDWQSLFTDEKRELDALNTAQAIADEVTATIDKNAPALIMGNAQISHGDLNLMVEALAESLNIESGQRIILHLPKSIDFVVWMLACMRKGLVVIPLPVDADLSRRQQIVECADAAYVASLEPRNLGYNPILTEGCGDVLLGYRQPINCASKEAAIVMFTSGTTGKPKGVMLPLETLLAHSRAMAKTLSLKVNDRVLWFASSGADTTLEQLLMPLEIGASVVIPEKIWSMAEFLPQVAHHGVTVADLPPVYCQWLMRVTNEQRQLWKASPLRMLLMGGEAMPLSVIKAWQRMHLTQSLQLFNMYGPTEATITASVYQIPADFNALKVSLGKPTAKNRFLVLDSQSRPVPAGVEGMLYIAGERLANGYLFNSEKTAEAFVTGVGGERMYCTGDVVKWFPDGTLWFVGRKDSQVKIRGHRVELDAVQRYLEERASIHEATVFFAQIQQRNTLVAFVVASGEQHELAKQTIAAMRAELPHYMVPNRIEVVEQIPLTANGKVDSKRLLEEISITDSHQPRLKNTERKVAELVAQVLGQYPQSGEQSFYDLGGDSLQALQLISLFSAKFGVEIELQRLLANSTIDELAQLVEQSHDKSGETVVCLSQSTTLPVVLCIPGAGGTAGDFLSLAATLPGYSIYALQAPGLLSGQIPHDFEHWLSYAEYAVKALPQTPIMVVGHSMGGWLGAHLRQRCFAEAKLVLLDSYIQLNKPENVEDFIAKQVHARLASMSLHFSLPSEMGLEALILSLSEHVSEGDSAGVSMWLNLLKLTRAQLQMKPLWGEGLGKVTLINAEQSMAKRGAAKNEWAAYCEVEDVIVDGDHYTILEHKRVPTILLNVLKLAKEQDCA
ncbi:amino acid adenylation domain-containing protein [Aestuariibacter sp. AA17]|uniref:Amino acid adenylation domain-containing protein n=1 Tax=Fluctibacter corallii TaxID=2984329 RepID=A0ABT3A812_9ALTE|nr:non-ribosomal peptide synthetase [Aestuariibacter sp. AA17]MCV2884826.1 amino acid adenylation domain-containing protein [Aestuariibacter sp. AA17]